MTNHFQRILHQLRNLGFLLESDPNLPSVCTLITREPLKTSWWSHPMAQIIFQVNEQLDDHKDVLITKLVSGKVTFVHRKLWPEILAIGVSREPWQLKNLSNRARWLLQTIDERGSVTTDELPTPPSGKAKVGELARELEKKLLIHGAQVHTKSGAHAKVLETWPHWARRIGFKSPKLNTAVAKEVLETLLLELNQKCAAFAKLPWQ